MSIEFKTQIRAPISDAFAELLKRELVDCCRCELVRDRAREFGLRDKHSPAASASLEEITVVIGPEEIYIAFHAGSRNKREQFLACCRDVLAKNGIVADFEGI